MDMGHGPTFGPHDAMPALRRELLALPDPTRLEPARRADHPPRIPLLFSGGSQSFNAVNTLRLLGRWIRMVTILTRAPIVCR